MLGVLRVSKGKDEGRTFSLQEGHQMVVGTGEKASARLFDTSVGVEHFKVQLAQRIATLTALDKGRDTVVNGKAVTEHNLREGDLIEIGQTFLTFEWSYIDEQATLLMDE